MKYVFEEKANKRNALQYKTHLRLATINQSYINYSERAFASLSNLLTLSLVTFSLINTPSSDLWTSQVATFTARMEPHILRTKTMIKETFLWSSWVWKGRGRLFHISSDRIPTLHAALQIVCSSTACIILASRLLQHRVHHPRLHPALQDQIQSRPILVTPS